MKERKFYSIRSSQDKKSESRKYKTKLVLQFSIQEHFIQRKGGFYSISYSHDNKYESKEQNLIGNIIFCIVDIS